MTHTHIGICRRQSSKRKVVLLLGVSGFGLLQGCSFFGETNPFSNERPPQLVVGARRPPALNAGGSGFNGIPLPSGMNLEPIPNEPTLPAPARTSADGSAAANVVHVRKPISGNPGGGPASGTDSSFVSQIPKSAGSASNATPIDANTAQQVTPSPAASSHSAASADDDALPPFKIAPQPATHASNAAPMDNSVASKVSPSKVAPSPTTASIADDDDALPPFKIAPQPAAHASNAMPMDTNIAPKVSPSNVAPSPATASVTDDDALPPFKIAPQPVVHANNNDSAGAVPQLKPLTASSSHNDSSETDETSSPVVAPLPRPQSLNVVASPKEVSPAQGDALPPPWKSRSFSTYNGETGESGHKSVAAVVPSENKNIEKTPELSSVPPNPPVFSNIKQESRGQLETLRSEQAKAEEGKASLAAEPSQQPTPQGAKEAKVAPVAVPLAEKHAPPVISGPVVTAVEPAPVEPGMPRRGIDIVTQSESPAQPAPVAPTPAAAVAPKPSVNIVMPVEKPAPPASPAPVAAAVATAPAAPDAPKPGVDIMTQADWEALHKAPAAQTSPAAPSEVP